MHIPALSPTAAPVVRVDCPGRHVDAEYRLPRAEPATAHVIRTSLTRAFAIGPTMFEISEVIFDVGDVPGAVIPACPHCPRTWAVTNANGLCATAFYDLRRTFVRELTELYADGRWDGQSLAGDVRGNGYSLMCLPVLTDGHPALNWRLLAAGRIFQTQTANPQEGAWLRKLLESPGAIDMLRDLARLDDIDHLATLRDAFA